MSDQIYHELRECINQYAIGFNETESQIEIKLLKKLFTEESARMFMLLKHELEPVQTIAARADIDIEKASALLAEMTQKGLTFPIKRDGIQYYAAAPFVHGMSENFSLANSESPDYAETAKIFNEYMTGGFFPAGPAMRTIPINDGVETHQKKMILPFENVNKIIESKEKIGVVPCPCNTRHNATTNSPCDQKSEVCIGFDFYAEYVIEGLGKGRWLTKEEALNIIKQAEEDGLVHNIGGGGNDVTAICNCCRDCCDVLKVIKLFPVPGELVLNNFTVSLDTDACINCEVCVERCPMGAFSEGEELVTLNLDKCIGCGLCTTTCSGEALVLKSKAEEDRTDAIPPETYKFMRPSADWEADIERNKPRSNS